MQQKAAVWKLLPMTDKAPRPPFFLFNNSTNMQLLKYNNVMWALGPWPADIISLATCQRYIQRRPRSSRESPKGNERHGSDWGDNQTNGIEYGEGGYGRTKKQKGAAVAKVILPMFTSSSVSASPMHSNWNSCSDRENFWTAADRSGESRGVRRWNAAQTSHWGREVGMLDITVATCISVAVMVCWRLCWPRVSCLHSAICCSFNAPLKMTHTCVKM